mmetsp:Transcript_65675/g.207498  ORF Transcript_65675/g.207498 Transcript_65675/m.207498 type:complete len:233 (+) Transcript_65675:535-1233(+)
MRRSRGTKQRNAVPAGAGPGGRHITCPRTAATTGGQLPSPPRQASTNCSQARSRPRGRFPPQSSARNLQYSVSPQGSAPPPRLRAWRRYSRSSSGQPAAAACSADESSKRSLASEISKLLCLRKSSFCRRISSVSVPECKVATRDVAVFQGSCPTTHLSSSQPTASRSSAGERSPQRPARIELKSRVPLTVSKGGEPVVLEMPKSISCGLVPPLAPRRMLAGFRSQWTRSRA